MVACAGARTPRHRASEQGVWCQCRRQRFGWPRARPRAGARAAVTPAAVATPVASAAPAEAAGDSRRVLGEASGTGRPAAAAPAQLEQQPLTWSQAAQTTVERRWQMLLSEGRLTQLVWEARLVLSRQPGWPLPRMLLATALSKLGRYAEAERVIAEGPEHWPRDPGGNPEPGQGAELRELHRRARELLERIRLEGRGQHGQSDAAPSPSVRRSKVVVASAFCGDRFFEKMRPARENHERWCALHGYEYACLRENIAGRDDPTWSKIPLVLQLLREGADYVFWMDADSLFLHDGVDLQWACDLERDFVFAGDLNVVFNAGHFLARRGEWATRFLEGAFRIHPWPLWEDNGAMMIMLGGGSPDDEASWMPAFERMKVPTRSREECARAMEQLLPPGVAAHVACVPQHLMNSYEWPGGGGRLAVVRGDPILHFAGCSAGEKEALVERYAGFTGDPHEIMTVMAGPGPQKVSSGSSLSAWQHHTLTHHPLCVLTACSRSSAELAILHPSGVNGLFVGCTAHFSCICRPMQLHS